MSIEVVSVICKGMGFTAPGEITYRQLDNRFNQQTPCQLYQKALETSKADIIIYAHDDVKISDPQWLQSVILSFYDSFGVASDDNRVAVGLGGAVRLAKKDLYRKPFNIWNLARDGYCSNQEDAETHGDRFTGVKQVAVLDAFFMAVRRDFLLAVGGWPIYKLTHHCLDLWLACQVARAGKQTWMTGIACNHYGGRTSTNGIYPEAKWLQGGSVDMDHLIPHTWIADEFRDVLPLEVK